MAVVPRGSLDYVDLPGRRSADPLAGMPLRSSLRIVELTPDPDRTAHLHPHTEEVVVVLSGSGHVWIEGERTAVSDGDIVVIPAGSLHATIPEAMMRLACFFPHPDLARNIEESDRLVVEPPPTREEDDNG